MQKNIDNKDFTNSIRRLRSAYKSSISFDTETSGLDENIHKIWQVGGIDSLNKKFNKYIKIADTPLEALEKLSSGLGKDFFEKQEVNIRKYLNALSSDKYINQEDTLKFLSEKFKGRAILMHNHNFEGKFLGELAIKNPSDSKQISSNFRYRTDNPSGRFLFRPPEVQNASVYADDAYNKFILGDGSHSEVVKARRNVISAYANSLSSIEKSIVIDNMDISKSLLSELAEAGHIDKRLYAFSGSSMEFIAKHFLGKDELHDAVSDAAQTKHAGIKMLNLISRLNNNKLLASDSQLILNMSNDINSNIPRSIVSSINKAMQESSILFGRKPYSRYTDVRPGVFLTEDTPSGPIKHQINRLVHKYHTPKDQWIKDKVIAAEDAVRQYSGISRDVDNMVLNALGAIRDGKDITEDTIRGGLNVSGSKEAARNIVTKISKSADAYWHGLSTAGKFGAVALAGAATFSAFSDSPKSKENIENIKIKKEALRSKSYNNSTLNMYTNINNYHGSGFVSWNNRTNHHEY